MKNLNTHQPSSLAKRLTCLGAVAWGLWLQTSAFAASPFVFDLEGEPIMSATFTGDFAALTAHREVSGFEVNSFRLVGSDGMELDLSGLLFGNTVMGVDPALIDQGLFETGFITVPIDPSFFPGMMTGVVGINATLTDTADALFAIDFFGLSIVTSGGTKEAFINMNDGFGVGLADGETLSNPLPLSIPQGVSGTGFDEAIGSKSIFVVPEPSTGILMAIAGLFALTVRRRR